METRRVSRGEIEPPQQSVPQAAGFGRDGNARPVEVYAIRHAPQPGKPGFVSPHCARLRRNEGFGRGEELVSIDQDARHVRHAPASRAMSLSLAKSAFLKPRAKRSSTAKSSTFARVAT